MNNVPNLRFKEFSSEWESKRLGSICEITMGQSPSSSCYNEDKIGLPLIQGNADVKNRKTFPRLYTSDITKTCDVGDVIMSVRAPVGAISKSLHNACIGRGVCSIKPKQNSEFIYQFLLNYEDKWSRISQGSTFESVNSSDIASTKVSLPSSEEQEKIASFFSLIDKKIELQTEKVEELKNYKKGIMQKMFPRNGETVPELRFAGFTNAWEQRKLEEMLEERNEQIPENDEYPLMSFVQGAGVSPKGDRYDRSFLVKEDNKKYKKTELGDFIYSSNNLETGSIGFNRTGKAVISPVYSIFSSKNELESRFIGILSTRKDFIAKMVRFRQGVVYGQWRIHEKDFLDIKITVPKHEEQKEIIDFFTNFDNLITLHQCKLDALNEYKKGLLQQMFI